MKLATKLNFLVVLAVLLLCPLVAAKVDDKGLPAADNEIVFTAPTGVKRYIIMFKDAGQEGKSALSSLMKGVETHIESVGGKVVDYLNIIQAMVADVPSTFINAIKTLPGVETVEEDRQVHTMKKPDGVRGEKVRIGVPGDGLPNIGVPPAVRAGDFH
ncbi:hypothetical protein BJ742DRAFT_814186 [Cladochytrium replicatum]|nr:hypothetical protein BJ742DRAFT_814186 [Cladochytrium replicatum]